MHKRNDNEKHAMTIGEEKVKTFMDRDFLLGNKLAKTLYHEYAETMPIIDYHCHINPREIAENRNFDNITQLWLGGDHYKWRFMRSCGVDEMYISGNATDYEKFCKWAECVGKAIGNPLFHWSHLELQRYFGYNGYLNKKTADEVWNICNEKLKEESMSVRNIIIQSNVKFIGTTDDPIDSLEWHQKIAADDSFNVVVAPSWRPDRAMNIEKSDFLEYLLKLEAVTDMSVKSFADVKKALEKRMRYFNENGCKVSDHAMEYVMYEPASEEAIENIFSKRVIGKNISKKEELQYKTAFMIFMGKMCYELDWGMQLHYGCKRDSNQLMYRNLGPDSGYDCISNYAPSAQLADFLNALIEIDKLPRTIIYNLNPIDNAAIGTILGCFQDSTAIAKIQQGSAWWFNDHKKGMEEQLISLANLGNLSGFIGMLTDSRSFLSYTRHEYFRRILCDLIGSWVENGEFPADMEMLEEVIKSISYYNAKNYFRLPIE